MNAAWWDLRLRYQGVTPPVNRTETEFDPGAKYHVPANTPYIKLVNVYVTFHFDPNHFDHVILNLNSINLSNFFQPPVDPNECYQ